MGHDEQGRCPMLRDDRCSIYEHRPRTCRTYDCRVFAAAGIDGDRDEITARTRRWRFDYPTDTDRAEHAAVQAAARFLRERAECFPGGAVPDIPAQVAIVAVKVYEVFLEGDDPAAPGSKARCGASDAEIAQAVVEANAR